MCCVLSYVGVGGGLFLFLKNKLKVAEMSHKEIHFLFDDSIFVSNIRETPSLNSDLTSRLSHPVSVYRYIIIVTVFCKIC